jgi:hypothetical protein
MRGRSRSDLSDAWGDESAADFAYDDVIATTVNEERAEWRATADLLSDPGRELGRIVAGHPHVGWMSANEHGRGRLGADRTERDAGVLVHASNALRTASVVHAT